MLPVAGQAVILKGYPAGSRSLEIRHGIVYFERLSGQWIAHIKNPDEPVVTGMSGGPVINAETEHQSIKYRRLFHKMIIIIRSRPRFVREAIRISARKLRVLRIHLYGLHGRYPTQVKQDPHQ